MPVSSGNIPYSYTGPYPWISPKPSGSLGFSGIVYEEAMFAILSEIRRYADPFFFVRRVGQPRHLSGILFQNYINPSGAPPSKGVYQPMGSDRTNYAFEPHPSGINLNNLGNINTTDWIQDMRQALSGFRNNEIDGDINGLFELVSYDVNLNDNYIAEWLAAKVGNTRGGQRPYGVRTWNREYYTEFGLPPIGTLGFSGVLYDIDFDEVYYQPFPRLSVITNTGIGGDDELTTATLDGGITIDAASPIFPAFAQPDGTLISLSTRDQEIHFSNSINDSPFSKPISGLYSYYHVSSGLVRVDGDVLLQSNNYIFGANPGTFTVSGARRLTPFSPEDYGNHPQFSRVFIQPPNSLSILKSVVPFSTFNNDLFPASGERIHIYPSNNVTSTFNATEPSGFEYLNDALWTGTRIVDEETRELYGFHLLSPISRNRLWVRHGPQVGVDPLSLMSRAIVDKLDVHRHDSSTTNIGYSGGLVDGSSNRWQLFTTYDDNFAITSNLGAATIGGHDFQARRYWENGILAYLYNKPPLSGVLDTWDFPTFINPTSYRLLSFDSSVNLGSDTVDPYEHCGVYENGESYMAVGSPSEKRPHGFALLTLMEDVTDGYHLFTVGPLEPIVGTNVGFAAGTKFRIRRVEVVDSATDFNEGIWAILAPLPEGSNELNDLILCRLERGSSQWDIVEFYAQEPNTFTFLPQTANIVVPLIDYMILKLPFTI